MEINLLDLFSGMGGFHLGLKKAGFKVNAYNSEIDKYAIQVYKQNFKNSNYVGSVTDVQGGKLPKIDAITFGSPCQDFSIAGKRKGMGGDRSSLITEAIRLIDECRPRFFIWENVKGTFSSNNGADFWAIIQAFTNIGGYRLEWQLLNTKWFLPQNRERIYLVGYTPKGSGGQIFPITDINSKINELQRQQTNTITSRYRADGQGSYIIERELEEQIKVKSATSKGYQIATKGDSINYQNIKSETRRGRVGKGIAQTLDTLCEQAVISYNIPEMVSVRKYEVDIKGLQELLKKHKKKTIKQISEELSISKTQAEHWFRSDNSFSIPPRDIWVNLKKVLGISDDSFDKSIMTFEERESKYEKTNRVYDVKGIAPTITSSTADERILTNRIRRLTPIECERLQGFPDDWTKFGTEGLISDTQRYKMCGNAVTVNVVQAVGESIIKYYK